jgi:hypothetical protein
MYALSRNSPGELMIRFRRWLPAACLLACSFSQARAQDAGAAIAEMGRTPEYAQEIYKALVDYEATLPAHCPKIEFSGAAHTTLLGAVKFGGGGRITDGRWKETAEGHACGAQRLYNVLVVERYGVRTFAALAPGSTEASPELQQQTGAALKQALDGCAPLVADTHLEGNKSHRQPDGSMSSWKETWEVHACEKDYTVPIVFIPDQSGISIALPKSKLAAH